MAKIIIMSGLPASGKSTAAQAFVQESGNMVRLNKDLLRTMLHFDKWTGLNEAKTWNAEVSLAIFYLTDGTSIVVDDTNLNPKTVQRWRDIAKKLDAKIEYAPINTPVEECIKRDAAREKQVGAHVIQKMALQYREYLAGKAVVICDLDGTLCDITHRLHFVKVAEGEKKDWKSFFENLSGDTLRQEVLTQVESIERQELIFVSARPERYRKETLKWLQEKANIIDPILIMREDSDSRPDTEVKADIYEKYLKKLNILKVFDDRPSVIRMWHEKGLNVVDCGSGVEF